MKRYLSAVLAATLIAGLTACGGGSGQASPSTESSASPPAKPSRATQAIPDVAGKTFLQAKKALVDKGFSVSVVGSDGKIFRGNLDDTLTAISTIPAAGEVVSATAVVIVKVNTTAVSTQAKETPAPRVTGLAATLPQQFPGYPLIVNVSSIDYRVANWFEGKLVDGQVVALIPGVYTPYNPHVPDLLSYYEDGGDGDSAMRKQYMPGTGGAGWSGVLPGSEEPK